MALCTAVMMTIGGATAGTAHADALGKIGGAVQGAGKALKKGAQNTGKAIVRGAENTGEAIEKGIQKTGEVITGKKPEDEDTLVQVPPPDAPRYLFVQQARTATANGNQLTLSGLTPSTYYFTDRPARSAGHLEHTDFAALWDDDSEDSFKSDPPNAALTTPGQVDDDPIVVELLSANYDGSVMTFRFNMISGKLPDTARDVAIFIDTNNWGGAGLAAAVEQ
jgi:hypothetical protein